MKGKITKLIIIQIGLLTVIGCGSKEKTEGSDETGPEVVKVKPEPGSRSSSTISNNGQEFEVSENEIDPARKYKKQAGGRSGLSAQELMAFGKAVFTDAGQYSDILVGDMKNYSLQDISIQNAGTCGVGGCGKELHLVNNNPTRSIRVSVESIWKLGGAYDSQLTNYEVGPKEDIHIGCSHWCGVEETVQVGRRILGAEFMN